MHKVVTMTDHLAKALELAAKVVETSQSSVIRQALIVYLRRLGDQEIDAQLDALKARVEKRLEYEGQLPKESAVNEGI